MSKKPLRWPVAILDIGSNSVRLVVFNRENPKKPFFNEKVTCLLGKDMDKTGRLNPAGKKTARAAIAGFLQIARALGARKVHALATAAIRDARDGKAFVRSLNRDLRASIKIISGSQEARYSALGVLSCDPETKGVVADLGGGSLELARIGRGRVHEAFSLPLGTLRLHGRGRRLQRLIDKHMEDVPKSMYKAGPLHAAGGTCRAIAAVHGKINGRKSKVKGYVLSRAELMKLYKKLQKMPPERMARTLDVDKGRARTLPQACFLLAHAMSILDSSKLVITTRGLRDGYLHDVIGKSRKS
jgi:exopolyphosphatase/guanosine-5'-triphosphate,3'-diphosphate pyrophosphatase